MKNCLSGSAITALLLTGSSVQAQEWKYTASVYLFTAETETGIGDRSATLSFSDALENLDTAFMGAFEAHNGRFGFLLDYMLTDISFRKGPAAATLNASVRTQIVTGYFSYRLYDTGSAKTDLLAGLRWFDTDTTLSLVNSRSVSDDWTDPVLGVRSQFRFNDNWSGTLVADYGGSDDRETWQILLTADYAFNDRWTGRVGYRHIDVSNDERANSYSFRQSGPVIGVSYNF